MKRAEPATRDITIDDTLKSARLLDAPATARRRQLIHLSTPAPVVS